MRLSDTTAVAAPPIAAALSTAASAGPATPEDQAGRDRHRDWQRQCR